MFLMHLLPAVREVWDQKDDSLNIKAAELSADFKCISCPTYQNKMAELSPQHAEPANDLIIGIR